MWIAGKLYNHRARNLPQLQTMSALSVGLEVRFTGGKYNGFEGQVAKLCDEYASVIINYDGKPHELVESTKFLTPLAQWLQGKNEDELRLRGHNT